MRTCSWRTGAGLALGLAVLLPLFATEPLRAQRVQGIVLDELSHAPVKGADVSLLGMRGKVVGRELTDSTGRFTIAIPALGAYAVKVHALGYTPFLTHLFVADTSQEVSAQVNLVPVPIALKGLSVSVAAMRQELERVGFYRREKAEVSAATFLGPKQIRKKLVGSGITDAFYGIPGVRVRPAAGSGGSLWDITMPGASTQFFGRVCYPSIYLDGDLIRHGGTKGGGGEWTTLVNPNDVAGIEVYPTAAGLPPWATGSDSPCGAILIWTKSH